MISALVLGLGVGLLGADPADGGSVAKSLETYEQAKASLGRGPEAHVRLALWCEQHGLSAERVKHLALAVLSDPKNATARGLMGLVDYRGKWERPEKVSEQVKADEALTAALAEYNARRSGLGAKAGAEAHWKLALWCEENGLKPEARAHFVAVTRLDPSRDAAWKKLGLKKQNGRWVSEAQLAEERAEAAAQKKADRHWKPLMAKYREWLRGTPEQKARAEAALADVTDPRAVPALCATFVAGGKADDQAVAVPVLGRLDGPAASKALALIAAFGGSPEVARSAAETLKLRDSRDVIGQLIGLIVAPIRYEVRPVNGPNLPGELFIDGQRAITRRIYMPTANIEAQLASLNAGRRGRLWRVEAPTPQAVAAPTAVPSNASPAVRAAADAEVKRQAEEALLTAAAQERIGQMIAFGQQRLEQDVASLEGYNAAATQRERQVGPVLHALTGQDFGPAPEDWRAWWADEQGYAYSRQTEPTFKPVVTEVVPNPVQPYRVHHSCFAAGTPVKTLEGPRPIETLRVGDQVLSQDVSTGRLMFTPVVAVFHNKPAPTFRIRLGGEESVVATGIHRFWKAGKGWVMARDVKPGDLIRTLGGTARVESVESDAVQPVFNLEVAEGQSFFVGDSSLLAHDNSQVDPVPNPFDAPAEVAALK
ncbi:MAG: polymorphic toxin-type HINT domain-containing protein [Isosphaeraceae bacterium]